MIADKIKEVGSQDFRINTSDIPNFVELIYHTSEGRPHFMDRAKNNEVILLTPNYRWKVEALLHQGITSENTALLLATADLEITVPGFTFDIAGSEEVIIVRKKLEEREKYLSSIITLTNETFDRISTSV